jgi:SMI1 / KNR4 family (SUKH-1)
MPFTAWPQRWDALRKACEHRHATGRWAKGADQPPRFEIAPPAVEADIAAVEQEFGCPLPGSLRHVLTKYSAAVCIEWALPKSQHSLLPKVFREIFAGECRWSLDSLPKLHANYQQWLEAFTDPEDKYDGPWQNKFPVLEVGNGDMLAIELRSREEQPVVYLSHDGDDTLHGFWLGHDFEDYIDRLSQLGCVGAEDWQMAPFVNGPRTCLDFNGTNAKLWREWFGLTF